MPAFRDGGGHGMLRRKPPPADGAVSEGHGGVWARMGLLTTFRERFHPYHRLKQYGLGKNPLYRWLDRPVFYRPHGAALPVCMRLMRHLSYILDSRIVEPGVLSFVRAYAVAEPIADFWDVGANFGFYGWVVRAVAPGSRVLFVEPDADNISCIRDTISRNGLTGAIVIAAAASDREGHAEFVLDRVSGMTGSLDADNAGFNERHYGTPSVSVTVPTTTLDTLACRYAGPSLLKIDVEGAEQRVFAGAAAMLAERQPTVIFEATPGKRDDFLAHLAASNYRIFGADRPDQPAEQGFNRIALPARLQHKEAELLAAWRARYADLAGRRSERESSAS